MIRPSGPSGEGGERSASVQVPPEVAAAAAAWIAKLHGPDRTRQLERECLAWQAESAVHRVAFERCTEIWMDFSNLQSMGLRPSEAMTTAAPTSAGKTWHFRVRSWTIGVALAVVVAAVAGAFLYRSMLDGLSTDIGEQRQVLLEDGSILSLNTATRVKVNFTANERTVTVQEGEALFEVAKDPGRPFVVRVAGREIRALGTKFLVRLSHEGDTGSHDEAMSVALIEGKVLVRPIREGIAGEASARDAVYMSPGERAKFNYLSGGAGQAVVVPMNATSIERLLAWKRSEAVFEGASLADAVAEMNRYNRHPIVLAEGMASLDARVSGQFRIGDSLTFSNALAKLYGLNVVQETGRIVLTRPP